MPATTLPGGRPIRIGDPFTITQSGWYTFQHHFRNNGGVLAVDMTVSKLGSSTLSHTWTLSDLSDTIGDGGTVGGNRYGYLATNDMPLALDNITRSGIVVAPTPTCTPVETSMGKLTAAVVNPAANYAGPLPLSGCQIGVYFNKAGSVKNADIAGATHYGVFADNGAKVDVTGSRIHQIGDNPFSGNQNGRAVFFANGATGTVNGNTISDYQKNGLVATGDKTAVQVLNNTVTGRGPAQRHRAERRSVFLSGGDWADQGQQHLRPLYTPTATDRLAAALHQAQTDVKQQANYIRRQRGEPRQLRPRRRQHQRLTVRRNN